MDLKCTSHQTIEKSVERQEIILERMRSDNAEHRLHMATQMSEICTKMDQLVEVKDTLRLHNQRRDDDNKSCEEQRTDLWIAINATNSRLDKRDGITAIVAAICSGIGAAIGAMLTIWAKMKSDIPFSTALW